MSEKPHLSVVPHLPQEHARKDAIEALEDMLEMTKSGEIIAIAVVGLRPDDTCCSIVSGCTKPVTLLGALDVLKSRYRRHVMDQES